MKHPVAAFNSTVKELNNRCKDALNTTCAQDDTFLLEATELKNDSFSPYAVDVTYAPDAPAPPAGLPQAERAVQEGQIGGQALVAEHQRPSEDLHDVFATPKVRIPRKQKPAGAAPKEPLGIPRMDTVYSQSPEEVGRSFMAFFHLVIEEDEGPVRVVSGSDFMLDAPSWMDLANCISAGKCLRKKVFPIPVVFLKLTCSSRSGSWALQEQTATG